MTDGPQHPRLRLRAAHAKDVALVREWRNDPDAVRFSETSRPVGVDEHSQWFTARLTDPDSRLWIAEEGEVPIGQVRVDRNGDNGVFSISVAVGARGRGIGQAVLRAAIDEIAGEGHLATLTAVTHPENLASIQAFERVGFRRKRVRDSGFVVLELRLR